MAVQRATTRAARAQQTRTRILETALPLFRTRGYEATSLQLIADEIGVTKAAVYYHFRTKPDIVLALIEPMFDDIDALLTRLEKLPQGAERFEAHVAGFAELFVSRRHTLSLIMADPVIQEMLRAWLPPPMDFERRALALLFGDDPNPRQLAGHLAAGKLVAIVPRMRAVDDETLRAVLTDIVRGLWDTG